MSQRPLRMTRHHLPRQVIAYTVTDVDGADDDEHFKTVQSLLQDEAFIEEAWTGALGFPPNISC
jgi:hypothetical protein